MYKCNIVHKTGSTFEGPIKIQCNNTATIAITEDPQHHGKMRSACLNEHLVREQVSKGLITINYVDTKSQLMDIFTKLLAKEEFLDFLLHRKSKRLAVPVMGLWGGVATLPSEQ